MPRAPHRLPGCKKGWHSLCWEEGPPKHSKSHPSRTIHIPILKGLRERQQLLESRANHPLPSAPSHQEFTKAKVGRQAPSPGPSAEEAEVFKRCPARPGRRPSCFVSTPCPPWVVNEPRKEVAFLLLTGGQTRAN